MPRWTRSTNVTALGVVVILMVLVPAAQAQTRPTAASGPDVGISVVGLASVQPSPSDGAYLGIPFLYEGLSGVGAGLGAGVNIATRQRVVVTLEFSTAALQVQGAGRRRPGDLSTAPVHTPPVGRLRDSLLTIMAGFDASSRITTRVHLLAGVSRTFVDGTLDNVPIDQPFGGLSAPQPAGTVAFTGGVDVFRLVRPRLRLLGSFRYSNVPRSIRETELGVGRHVVRLGGGLQFRLTQ